MANKRPMARPAFAPPLIPSDLSLAPAAGVDADVPAAFWAMLDDEEAELSWVGVAPVICEETWETTEFESGFEFFVAGEDLAALELDPGVAGFGLDLDEVATGATTGIWVVGSSC